MTIVVIENLTKSYDSIKAVEDFSCAVDKGWIYALVGPDGAGKTSLLRAACGLVNFESGKINIAGYDVVTQFDQIKPLLGYMPQAFSLYPDLSVEENLRFYAGLFGLNKPRFESKKGPLYEFSGLKPFAGRRAGNLSGGMKQKLALSCALIHDPEVLILDEPTTGVDPLSRRQFWNILKALRDDGSTIIVSTPYMDEVSLADRAVFIHQGVKLAEGTPEELAQQYKGVVYRVRVEPTTERLRRIQSMKGIDARRFGAELHIYAIDDIARNELIARLKPIGIEAEDIEQIPAVLEDAFIQLMGS